MKSFVLLCFVVLLAFSHAVPRPDDKYTTKYDNVDIDQILKSDRLLNNYVNCLLDKGKCTPDGEELKKHLPDALQSKCSKCSEKQKTLTKKVINFLIDNKPDIFKVMEAKYDPEGKYRKDYQEEAKKQGIKI